MAELDTSFYPRANPNALMETATQAMGIKGAQLDQQQKHLDLVNNQVGSIVNGFSSLASKPDLSHADFMELGQRLLSEGAISPDIYKAELDSLPPGADPGTLRKIATGYSLRALDAGQRFNAQFGAAGFVNNGQEQIPVTSSPLTGTHQIGSPFQNRLTPQDVSASAPIGVNADNQTITGTKGQQLIELGLDPQTGASPAGGNALMPAAPAGGPSAPVNALLPASPPPMPNGVVTTPGGNRGLVTTPVPGAVEAQTAVGGESGKQYAADLGEAASYQQRVNPLQKAIPLLEALGTQGTGPGTEQINQMRSFLTSMGLPINPDSTKMFDEAKKYLVQDATANGDTGTNDKLAATFSGNPSTEISNAAAVDVAKTALALRRMKNAQVLAFQQSGLAPEKYSAAIAQFNAAQDPRAFGLDLMRPEQRTALIQSLKGEERTKFAASLRNAVSLGLVTPPGAAQNGQ